MKIRSEEELIKYGQEVAKSLKLPAIIELIGDVGTGKTTFTRGLAKELGVSEVVTSPSFTISKSYALPGGGELVHYDFYRLKEPGLMADDLSEKISGSKNVVVIEWGDSISKLLPKDHIIIKFEYADDGREVNVIQ